MQPGIEGWTKGSDRRDDALARTDLHGHIDRRVIHQQQGDDGGAIDDRHSAVRAEVADR